MDLSRIHYSHFIPILFPSSKLEKTRFYFQKVEPYLRFKNLHTCIPDRSLKLPKLRPFQFERCVIIDEIKPGLTRCRFSRISPLISLSLNPHPSTCLEKWSAQVHNVQIWVYAVPFLPTPLHSFEVLLPPSPHFRVLLRQNRGEGLLSP